MSARFNSFTRATICYLHDECTCVYVLFFRVSICSSQNPVATNNDKHMRSLKSGSTHYSTDGFWASRISAEVNRVPKLQILRFVLQVVMVVAGSSLPRSTKKIKTAVSVNGESSSTSGSQRVAQLETTVSEALETNGSLNSLADLLQIAVSSDDVEIVVKSIFALYRSFTLVLRKGVLSSVREEDGTGNDVTGRRAVRTWMVARLDAFTDLLCGLLQDDNSTIRVRPSGILSIVSTHRLLAIRTKNLIFASPSTLRSS